MTRQTVYFTDWLQMRYQQAWDLQTQAQQALVKHKLANKHLLPGEYEQQHRLFLVEHPPVFTLGRSGSMDNLLLTEAQLQAEGIEFFPINRGGDITFHGPGQIVGYPILDLDCFFTDVHRYVRCIEEVIIRTLADYSLQGIRMKDYTGVWLAPDDRHEQFRKICAIGVHMSRWTTLHGWAFNVNTPLHYFDYIVPCGIADEDKTVTSMAVELKKSVDMDDVKSRIKRYFAQVFDCNLVNALENTV